VVKSGSSLPSARNSTEHPILPPFEFYDSDADCDFASVERVNRQHLLPILSDLVRKPFFRYFKVNLYCDCPFWPDDGMCMLRDCSVCECDNNEVPQSWLAADGLKPAAECDGEATLCNLGS
jgi:hypothetical protein